MNTGNSLGGAFGLAGLSAALFLAGCSKPPPPVKLHDTMAQVVSVQAQKVWDISNKGVNDVGDPDGSRLSSDDWANIVSGSQAVRDAAAALVNAGKIEVVAPGEKIMGEGTAGSSTGSGVQALIDKDRAGFNERAAALKASGDALLSASNAKDAAKLQAAAGELDGVCEACHVKYWYPQEVAAQKSAAK